MFRMRSTVIKVLLMCLFSLVFVLSIQAHEEEAILLKFTPKVGDEYSSAALLVLRADYTEDGKKEEFYSTVGVGFNIRFIEIDTGLAQAYYLTICLKCVCPAHSPVRFTMIQQIHLCLCPARLSFRPYYWVKR